MKEKKQKPLVKPTFLSLFYLEINLQCFILQIKRGKETKN